MLSRKKFLNEILIRGIQVLASFSELPEENMLSQNSDSLALTELSPSLLKMEAARLGINIAHRNEEDLRREVYAALTQQCHPKSNSSS
jgi:NOL1/NOP2/fmu family ribosome biogenesis protein